MDNFVSRLGRTISFCTLYETEQYGIQQKTGMTETLHDLHEHGIRLAILESAGGGYVQINTIRHGLSVWSGRSWGSQKEFMTIPESVSLITCVLLEMINASGIEHSLSSRTG